MLKKYIIFFIAILAFASSKHLQRDFNLLKIDDIQRLLKDHEKIHQQHHSPKLEDDHNPMNMETLNLIFKHNKPIYLSNDRSDLTIKEDKNLNKILCAITGTYGCGGNDYLYELKASDSSNNAKRDRNYRTIDDKDSEDQKPYETEAKNDIQLLFNDLEKQWLVDAHKELRCRDGRCGRDRDDRDDDDYDRNEGLRCRGNRCGRDRADYDRKDDYDDGNEGLRCRGNRCGRDRADYDRRDDYDDGNEGLRCRGNRCGRDRADYDRRDDYDDGNEGLRCRGNRCGGHRDDNIKTNENDRNDDNDLRCKGNRCGRSGTNIDIDNDFRLILDNHGKRYKLNNELDVIVLDADRLQEVSQLLDASPKKSQTARHFTDKNKMRLDKRKRTYNNLSDNKFKPKTNSPDPYDLNLNKIDENAEDRKVLPRKIWDEIIVIKQKPLKKQGLRLRTRLLPLTLNQKKKLSHSSLRIEKKETKKTPIPFVIEVNGIGQVIP